MIYIRTIWICLFLIACSPIEEPSLPVDLQEMIPDQEIWDGKIEITSDGRLQSVVHAGHIKSFQKQKLTLFSDSVKVDFYDQQGRHTSLLTSQEAKIDDRSDLFVALGNVVVISDSGAVLKTERLYWDRRKKEIHSDTLAVMTTDVDSLRGYNFKANEDLTYWTIQNPTGQTFRRRR